MQISYFSEILKKFAHAGRFRKEFKMKKLLKWLFVKEQTETVEVPAWTFEKNASEPSRDRYNKTHGLGETLI